MCPCGVSMRLNRRVIVRLNGTLIMVPEGNVMMEKCRFLASQEIALWKLCHQNKLIDFLKKFSAQQTNEYIILSKINVKGTFAQFIEEGLCIQGKGWMKRKL